jgi:hypothetical protein
LVVDGVPAVTIEAIRFKLTEKRHFHEPAFSLPSECPEVPCGVSVTYEWLTSAEGYKWFQRFRFFRERKAFVMIEFLDGADLRVFLRSKCFFLQSRDTSLFVL